jgi:hypothetical protein
VGEHVQKTGVAIETQRITFVRNGKRRETLEGPATIKLYPQLVKRVSWRTCAQVCSLYRYEWVKDTTELSISTERKFSLVNFVDSPGLVDGTSNVIRIHLHASTKELRVVSIRCREGY